MTILGGAFGLAGGVLAAALVRSGWYRRAGDRARLNRSHSWFLAPTGLLGGIALGALSSSPWQLALLLVFLTGGLVLSWSDLDVYRVPTWSIRIFAPALAVITIGWAWAQGDPMIAVGAGLGALAYAGLFYLVALVSTMGLGDVRLALACGLVLGSGGWAHMISGAMWTVIAAGVLAVILLIARTHGRKDATPFVPAMVAGTLLAALL